MTYRANDNLSNVLCYSNRTLASYDQASHAIRHTGARCQERDAHDIIWDVQGVADNGDLKRQILTE